jgi:putative transposase
MPKLRHYDKFNTARFITMSCYQRYRLFNHPRLYETFLRHLESFRIENEISVLGYVVMPNHVHLVLYPHSELKMGIAIGKLKSRYAYEIISGWKIENKKVHEKLRVMRGSKVSYAFWQLRCYDHNCRSPEIVREKIHYCHNNPVRAGLVKDPEEWRWSSYNCYLSNREEIVGVDKIDDLC